MPVFAMAGLAEAGLAVAFGAIFLGLLLVGLLVSLGALLRSRVASVMALALDGLITLLLRPWEAVETPLPSTDPDEQFWRQDYLQLVRLWAVITILTLIVAIWVSVRRHLLAGVPLLSKEPTSNGGQVGHSNAANRLLMGAILFIAAAVIVLLVA